MFRFEWSLFSKPSCVLPFTIPVTVNERWTKRLFFTLGICLISKQRVSLHWRRSLSPVNEHHVTKECTERNSIDSFSQVTKIFSELHSTFYLVHCSFIVYSLYTFPPQIQLFSSTTIRYTSTFTPSSTVYSLHIFLSNNKHKFLSQLTTQTTPPKCLAL